MANWQFELDFRDIWDAHSEGVITINEASGKVVILMQKLLPKIRKRNDPMYDEMANDLEWNIIPMFEEVRDNECDVQDFDTALEQLYDWADTSLDGKWAGKKMCWIRTV